MSIIILSALFAISCSSGFANKKGGTQFLDLSGAEHSELVSNYWLLSKSYPPQYPVSAARKGVSGCVKVVVGIGSDGRAKMFDVRSSFPEGVFDDYAISALRQWRWEATAENVNRTPVLAAINLDFTTRGKPDDPAYLGNCESQQ
ncbi:energy transducer TonB [Idiomarina sp. HP20-50]|uniref:energy transducer TonB n=1 Tax=Idiomarina sp. HP20-50 TaxID=3070813 RepID=UPI00294B3BA1|nr:energy transducer TonB [Idiomarina sp. HP20-50]MDV6315323.1 energy transducer TonB [Idiomarina sp. HP20-50]